MGCDIHAVFEKYVDGNWVQFGDDDSMCIGRNYFLFSILADVRNYSDIVPISKPKGFPENYDGYLVEHWEYDGHSRSWLTLQEILSYDWTKKIYNVEYTNDFSSLNWFWYDKISNKYAKFTGENKYKHDAYIVSEEHYKIFKKDLEKLKGNFTLSEKHVIKYTDSCSYSERVGTFFTGVIPDMIKESGGDFNSVRMVFCFDN